MRGLTRGHSLKDHGTHSNGDTAFDRRAAFFHRRVPLILGRSAASRWQVLKHMSASFHEKVLQILESVTDTDEVRTNLELPLYECQLLDSIKTVELMIGIEEEFGLKISPAEFERENWETPRKIIADLESRMQVNV